MQPLTRVIICLTLVFLLTIPGHASEHYIFEFGTRVLKYKDEGPDVAVLQYRLQQAGYYTGKIDGIFGKKTLNAVLKFQKDNKLYPDGIVGPKTYQSLPQSNDYPTRGTFTQEELIFLARVIHAEARGEPFKGQVAVGAVVLNRVESELFPDTIKEVILQEGQFCTLGDGQVHLYPSEIAIEAAKAAIMGYDPTYGSLFFYNPKTASRQNWVASTRRKAVKIGSHVFAW